MKSKDSDSESTESLPGVGEPSMEEVLERINSRNRPWSQDTLIFGEPEPDQPQAPPPPPVPPIMPGVGFSMLTMLEQINKLSVDDLIEDVEETTRRYRSGYKRNRSVSEDDLSPPVEQRDSPQISEANVADVPEVCRRHSTAQWASFQARSSNSSPVHTEQIKDTPRMSDLLTELDAEVPSNSTGGSPKTPKTPTKKDLSVSFNL